MILAMVCCLALPEALSPAPLLASGKRQGGASKADFTSKSESTIIKNKHYILTINGNNGCIESFKKDGRELIFKGKQPRPLFTIRFRDAQGKPIELSALDAKEFSLSREKSESTFVVLMNYKSLAGMPVHVTVRVSCPDGHPLTYWNLSVEHNTDYFIDHIDFPNVVVPNDLVATGGDARIFWPAMEGVLIENADIREKGWVRYKPIEFPNQGWGGYYPGPCPMQFMAYYGRGGGLYIAAHDAQSNIKGIEWHKHASGGIQLNYRLFPGGVGRGTYTMPYNMVLGVFDGDWYDAADIYRNWVESSKMPMPAKLYQNHKLPKWFKESPVVVTYPVRGTKDLGDMSPNEYYPYTNALPHIERLSKQFDSKILTLLMHWEGTAPWAPPYVWPPFGSKENFLKFVEGLHAQGNLAGVYCSGIAWTMKSNLCDYSREEEFKRKNLKEIMTVAPEGDVRYSNICSGPSAQRWSYDMCPANRYVEDVVVGQVNKIVNSGCDYIQYFDQNLGGACYFCYSKKHGHPPAPGLWMKEAMVKIYKRLLQEMEKSGRAVLIGCEAAAAEPFIPYLLFNDLRFNVNLWIGTPVPAYAYVYHEYVNNFMGNQNSSSAVVDIRKSPLNLHQRLAYSFISGDMLTVVLKNKGQIHWDWGTSWDVEKPEQESIITLIHNLNAWRKGVAMPFLCYGRMEKPYPVQGTYDIPMILTQGGKHHFPSLFTSRWTSPEGRQAQIIVNYTTEKQNFSLSCPASKGGEVRVYEDPYSDKASTIRIEQGQVVLSIAPLSALVVEFVNWSAYGGFNHLADYLLTAVLHFSICVKDENCYNISYPCSCLQQEDAGAENS